MSSPLASFLFFFNDTATTEIYTLSLHDALPISAAPHPDRRERPCDAHPECAGQLPEGLLQQCQRAGRHGAPGDHRERPGRLVQRGRSEEHTSELQSHLNLVCRLLLEKKKTDCNHHTQLSYRKRKTNYVAVFSSHPTYACLCTGRPLTISNPVRLTHSCLYFQPPCPD